jgi:hypothetical protein
MAEKGICLLEVLFPYRDFTEASPNLIMLQNIQEASTHMHTLNGLEEILSVIFRVHSTMTSTRGLRGVCA